jgi:hypothetical protein
VTAIPKANAGDLVVLRRSREGSSAGLYLVLERVERGLRVESFPVSGVIGSQRFIAVDEDVVWLGPNALPHADATLDPRPARKSEAPAPVEEPALPKVRVHVINADPDGFEITRPGRLRDQSDGVTTRYPRGALALVDRVGQHHYEFDVDEPDVDNFLRGVVGAYRPGQQPVVRPFSEEEA